MWGWGGVLEAQLPLAQQVKGGAHSSPFTAILFPDSKKVPICCWVDKSFQVIGWQNLGAISQTFGKFLHHNLRGNSLLLHKKTSARPFFRTSLCTVCHIITSSLFIKDICAFINAFIQPTFKDPLHGKY